MVVTVRNFNWNLDVFLTDILDICVAFFFVKLFCHQFEISVAFLFLRGSTLFFGNIGVGHVAGLVHEGLAPFHNLALVPGDDDDGDDGDDDGVVPGHRDGVALHLGDLFALLPYIRFKPSCFTFLQISRLPSFSIFFIVPRSVLNIVKVLKLSFHIVCLLALPGAMVVRRRVEFVELIPSELVVVFNC